jgi:hypothetical protein
MIGLVMFSLAGKATLKELAQPMDDEVIRPVHWRNPIADDDPRPVAHLLRPDWSEYTTFEEPRPPVPKKPERLREVWRLKQS